jgi:alcohol dehydrogenase class IV
VSAACGMDAFTQLIEAYVSPRASPITDALAFTGMRYVKDAIIPVCSTHALDIGVRSAMAYGSLMSGIALANAGLGIVHGLASSLGGLFEIPHGVACGTLLAESTKMNITQLQKISDAGKKGLLKYAMVGALLAGKEGYENIDVSNYCSILIKTLEKWTYDLNIDRLGKYGITIKEVDKIAEKAGLKNNPVQLRREAIMEIVRNRI